MSIVENRLKLVTQRGSDLYETVTGTDPETKLGYRFDQYQNIQMHLSVSKIGNPYYTKELEYDEANPKMLIVHLSESEILNEVPIANMRLINPPPFFQFYINATKDGRQVVLFNGIIERSQY